MSGADEFDLIARYFAPLATLPGARGLLDDVAVLTGSGDLVFTADAIVEGVHFLPDDPLEAIAQKALRVNISDLAAKGAAPLAYMLTLAWPKSREASSIAALTAGLAADQSEYGLSLIGGDTVATPGPLTLSVTAFGKPLSGRTPARSGASIGDEVWVTGTIGDGALGLRAAHGEGSEIDAVARAFLIDRYRRPRPRIEAAALVGAVATASMDVSDGLCGDAAKIAQASGVAIALDRASIPVSPAAKAWLAARPQDADRIFAGDDYEILFTAPPAALAAIEAHTATPLACIGRVISGSGVTLDGAPAPGGHVHRFG